ncbi:phosphoribosyltransferase [Morganella morganii]|nr:phosphoribosyltransferase [Morganella morganii]HCR3199359.1 phosphoribosyltransferase [Morganella morganii]HCT8188365.1 phosphoribosyltransferase [Morganella morganii]
MVNNNTVILVDDLLSTGTTLISASAELRNAGLSCTTAICLLSNL